uniref:Nuclear-pore anchor isoform X3 n=1 Tax=Rhizophora mucronata TaxID=61149 RepID=A0A2P2MGQ3_RHIMU
MILDERAEYERMVESYSLINQKLQHSISEQANLEKTIQELQVMIYSRLFYLVLSVNIFSD